MNHFERMHDVLEKNSYTFNHVKINVDLLLMALVKDKKNSSTQLRLILPDKNGNVTIGLYDNNSQLKEAVSKYFKIYRENMSSCFVIG